MNGNTRLKPRMARVGLAVLLAALAAQGVEAATLSISGSPASGWASTDNKTRFTLSLGGEFQDATTIKVFRVEVKNSSGQTVYKIPASTDSGVWCHPTTVVCFAQTLGTTYTAIKTAMAWGSYTVDGHVVVYAKKADGSPNPDVEKTKLSKSMSYSVPKPYGWFTAVTNQNSGTSAFSTKLGPSATHTIAGHTLEQIVRNPTIVVRGDGKACKTCHAWAESVSKEVFCGKVAAFNSNNTKPQQLKDLFNWWKMRNCPD